MNNTLYIFGGLPGAGKSELARHLARLARAVYLRIDSIEQAIRESGGAIAGPEGYEVAYRVAADNLRAGLCVVADSVNPIEITREAWRNVAIRSGVGFKQIEVKCSDAREHRKRIESRKSDVAGLVLPAWQEVVNREYHRWSGVDVAIDTATESPEQSKGRLASLLGLNVSSCI